MTCFHPVTAYKSRDRNPATGKYQMTFNPHHNLVEGSRLKIPCGNCIGCRVDRSKQWAMRCVHESKMHNQNCFITLTFNDEHMPRSGSVDVRTWQLFMKRLRKSVEPTRLRFFAAGEYSDLNLRPHYHALIFNYDFPDKKLWKKTNNKIQSQFLYRSSLLEKIWPFGFSTVGSVNYQSAAYVARYCMKKVGGDLAADHYTRPHPLTGELVRVLPEFMCSSGKPGIGYYWLLQFKGDCYPSDFLIVDGKKHPIPKYYDKKLQEEELHPIKVKRLVRANEHRADNTPDRLKVRETIALSRINQLKREV